MFRYTFAVSWESMGSPRAPRSLAGRGAHFEAYDHTNKTNCILLTRRADPVRVRCASRRVRCIWPWRRGCAVRGISVVEYRIDLSRLKDRVVIQLNLQAPARINHDCVNLVAVLALLDEINGYDGFPSDIVLENILPRLADDIRRSISHKTQVSTYLEERIAARDREIAKLERQLAEKDVELDFERTVFEKFLHALQALLIELPISDAWRVVNALVEENLLRF